MNIMLTCAGRRNYLVKYFKEALENRGRVFASDTSAEAPALQEADEGFVLPTVNHIDYFEQLVHICEEYDVRLLISLNDLELPLLARQRERFLEKGTIPVISSREVIDICNDKWVTFKFLESYNIPTAKTYLTLDEARQALIIGDIAFPLVVKPRWGSASIGIGYAEDDEELELTYRFVKKLLSRTILAETSACDPEKCILIQQRVFGQEHGLDIINDLNGSYVTTFVKQKLVMRAGETDRAVTVEDEQLNQLGEKIGHKLGHIGNLDCDVIVGVEGYSIIEMNPRFGGGYPFSHQAGGNLPAALIAWANGEKPDRRWLKVNKGVITSKCERLVNIQSLVRE